MTEISPFIYLVTQHAPGCIPDAAGTWYVDEGEATAAYEALASDLADDFYVADLDEYNIGDLLPDLALGWRDNEEISEEIQSLAIHGSGNIAATVYAAAHIVGWQGSRSLSAQLVRLGPWSWSTDVWTSPEARELVCEALTQINNG